MRFALLQTSAINAAAFNITDHRRDLSDANIWIRTSAKVELYAPVRMKPSQRDVQRDASRWASIEPKRATVPADKANRRRRCDHGQSKVRVDPSQRAEHVS